MDSLDWVVLVVLLVVVAAASIYAARSLRRKETARHQASINRSQEKPPDRRSEPAGPSQQSARDEGQTRTEEPLHTAPGSSPPLPQYNHAAVRNLIRDAFTPEGLRQFCGERPDFRRLLTRFGPLFDLDDMTDALLDYCQRQLLFPELLAAVQETDPTGFERHRTELYADDAKPKAVHTSGESRPSSRYNIVAIQDMLRDAFWSDEPFAAAHTFRRFCQDRPAFRPVLGQSSPGLEDMIETLTYYCWEKNLLPELLSEIHKLYPAQYEQHEAKLTTGLVPPDDAHQTLEHPPSRAYNVAVIRELLLVRFTAKDLRQFCQLHTAFRPVLARFGPASSLADMVDALIEYCEEEDMFPQLLIKLRKWPSPWYKRFEEQIFGIGSRQEETEAVPKFDHPALRQRVLDAFADDEPFAMARNLWRFCQERPAFRPVLTRFGPNPSPWEMAWTLIEYCYREKLLPELMIEAERLDSRPGQQPDASPPDDDASSAKTPEIGAQEPMPLYGWEDRPPSSAIRRLLEEAFTPEELWAFCAERTTFRPALAHFGANPGLADMVDGLLDYCHIHLLFSELLVEIRKLKPELYERYRTQFESALSHPDQT